MKEPCIILGGTGYASGELLRLLGAHPHLEVAAVVSQSMPGSLVGEAFPHLGSLFPDLCFTSSAQLPDLLEEFDYVSLFSALPHGHSAAQIADVVNLCRDRSVGHCIVDLSADFRHDRESTFSSIYNLPHGAPELMPAFSCSLPEFFSAAGDYACHPGCFTTATVLSAMPLARSGVATDFVVTAITGSTGSGKTPSANTHHPVRNSNVHAYKPLRHRHQPEMTKLLSGGESESSVTFTPLSGPFARGIYVTLHAELKKSVTQTDVHRSFTDFYSSSPFVDVVETPPKLKTVVGTNRAAISPVVEGRRVVVFGAIDNLVKGASGGGIHLMNKLRGWDETAGLLSTGLGWI